MWPLSQTIKNLFFNFYWVSLNPHSTLRMNETSVILIKLYNGDDISLKEVNPINDIFNDIFSAIHLKTSSAHDRTKMETKRSMIFLFFSTIPKSVCSRKM